MNGERGTRSAERRRRSSCGPDNAQLRKRGKRAFTLLELMLVVSILAVVSTLTYLTFSTVTRAWKRGMELADDLHHGDFVMDQLVMGLRSAYFVSGQRAAGKYGFWMEDMGTDPRSSDMISWVKLGTALVGDQCPFADTPHRVRFTLSEQEDDQGMAASVKAWRLYGQAEGFDPEKLPLVFLAGKVTGFNCRTAYRKVDDEIEWLDQWEDTNRVPTVVELTLYMEPLDEGEEPVEIKRVVGIPVAALSWR